MTFSIGRVLATAFRVWIRNLVPFTLITALIYSPLLIWGISAVQGEMDPQHLKALIDFERYSVALVPLLSIFVSAVLTYGVVMELQGTHASIGACIATGFARFFPVLGVGILSSVCILGAFAALIIPGPFVLCMLFVTTPAAVIERPGITGALGRSRVLTAGHRLGIFILLVLLFGVAWCSVRLIVAVTLPYAGDPEHIQETLARFPLYIYAELARIVLLGSFSSVIVGVTYYLLRSEKEGTTATELAAVFD
jgi:hypothetical protein